jgi:hypothetical protein
MGNAIAILHHGGIDREQAAVAAKSPEQRKEELTLNGRRAMRSGS